MKKRIYSQEMTTLGNPVDPITEMTAEICDVYFALLPAGWEDQDVLSSVGELLQGQVADPAMLNDPERFGPFFNDLCGLVRQKVEAKVEGAF